MKRLLVGGAIVIVAVILLYWKLGGGDSGNATTTSGSSSSGGSTTATPSLPAGDTVAWGSAGSATVTTGPDGTTTYQVGGYTIRDHRKGHHDPIDLPPNLHPPDQRKVAPTLVRDLTNQVRDVVLACAKDLPVEARGPKPKMEGQVNIAIKDHKVSVISSILQLRDVVGASVDPTKQCISDKLSSIAQAAPDEGDVESYAITMTVAMPAP